MKCPNCGGRHLAQDARCQAKKTAIEIARGRYNGMAYADPPQPTCPTATTSTRGSAPMSWVPGGEPARPSPDWPEDVEVTRMEPSGTAPPIAI